MSTNQFCYAITVGNKTKIGLSKNPESRVRTILTQSGVKSDDAVISIIKVKNMEACEKACHQHLSDSRVAGEWFTVDHQVAVDAINSFSLEGCDYHNDSKCMSLRDMEAIFSSGFRTLWERQINSAISNIVASGYDEAIAQVAVAAAACDSSLYELPALLRGAGEPEVSYLSKLFLCMESKNQDLLQSNVEFSDRVYYLLEHGEKMASDMRNKMKMLSSR